MNFWNIYKELDQMRDEMNRVYESNRRTPGDAWRLAFLPGYGARRYPRINLFDRENAYQIEALAPGLDPEKVNVSVTGNMLTISGEKVRTNGDVKPESYHRSERATGKFVRTIEMPGEINADGVEAEYKNGILIVTAPKTEKALPRKIEVKVA